MPAPKASANDRIDRAYAHFHRVLAELLTELVERGQPLWLEDAGHDLRPDHQANTYNPAIYRVDALAPYRGRLDELDTVQKEILALTGRSRPGRNLLPPLAIEGVQHVRISRHDGQTGRTITREQALARLEQLEAAQLGNLVEFERYASHHDERRKQVERDVRNLQKARERLASSAATEIRETYRQTVIRPYVYYADGHSEQLHMRGTGLLAAGPRVTIDQRAGPRRVRSDKVTAKPLAVAGAISFYDLKEWEAAKRRSSQPKRGPD